MKLVLKSILAGLAVTLSLILVGVAGLHIEEWLGGGAGDSVIKVSVYMLYWPLLLMEKLGVGPCRVYAEDFNERIICAFIAYGYSAVTYSLLSYMILRWRKREVVLR